MATRRKFTDEFKHEAVKLATQPGMPLRNVAAGLGVERSVLRRWILNTQGGRCEQTARKPLTSDTQAELEQVKRELAGVKMERDILKRRSAASRSTRREVWSSQDSVDTVTTPPGSDLKLIRADAAKMAVTTGSIVEGLDVVGDVLVRKIAVLVDVLLDPFFLQASEERFGDRIAPAVPFAAHARFEMVRLAKAPPGIASVLRALIR
jgi:transposase